MREEPKIQPFKTIRAILWGFFGVRKQQDYDTDIRHLKPAYIIIAGILAGILFVTSLLIIVNLIVP